MSKKLHDKSHTRLYRTFANMKQRCYNSKNPRYSLYGKRGIKICDEWLNDFIAFYDWAIANGYTDELTIDRIDSNKDYCPENCHWITKSENSRNVFQNPERITINRQKYYEKFQKMSEIKNARLNANLTQAEMSEKLGIPKRTIEEWERNNRKPPEEE